jgi:signal transduction histidine kinase
MPNSLYWISANLLMCAACAHGQVASLSPAPLRTVREIRALNHEEVSHHPAVLLNGVITYSEADWYLTFFTDETGGIYLGTTTASHFAPGDRVQVTGVAAEGLTSAIVRGLDQAQPEIRLLGKGPLPPAKDAAPEHLGDGTYDAEWITVRGTVRSLKRVNDRASLDLDLGAANLEGLICEFPDSRELPSFLAGVPVIAHGVLGTFSERPGVITRTALYIPSLAQCEPDPAYLDGQFRERPRKYSELFTLPRAEGRVHLQGQVSLARRERGFFMRVKEDGFYSGSLWVQTTQEISLRPGQLVDVVGRVESTNRKPLLRDAIARVLGEEAAPAPRFSKPEEITSGDYQGALIAVEGVVLGEQTGLEEDSLILLAGQTAVCARLDTAFGASHLPAFERGSRLAISGVCVVESQPTPGFGSLPFAFQIWMRNPRDVSLLASPPWWTMQRVMIALGIAVGTASAALLWIVALRRRVTSQTLTIREHVGRQTLQEERVRIAREFHDTFEQHLVGLDLTLQAAEAEIADPARVRELLREAAEMTRHTRAEAHHAIWELRTGALLASDVISLIKEELTPSAQAAHVALQVEAHGAVRPLPAVVQNHLLRIAQESFTNALKHARAGRVFICLNFAPGEVSLLVRDDGSGFDPAIVAKTEAGCFGLAGMRERALRMKGVFDIASSPGGGTQVQVRIPLPSLCS